jgi:endonuclease/exonuclease/phosphatase family metal-dependent hydrolase
MRRSPTALATLLLAVAAAAGGELKVMTFNLRYASSAGPTAWDHRRPLVRDVIRLRQPDLLGTQEGLAPQLAELHADLPGYRRIGQGREGDNRGEHMAIFILADRFDVLAAGDFWLSETPEIPASRSWGNTLPRMATWARLRDRKTRRELVLFNTHLDHQSQPSRERAADLLRARLDALPAELPVLLVGDFNAVAGANPVHARLLAQGFLTDLFRSAPIRRNAELDTYNGFLPARREGRHIDWILGRGPWIPLEAEVVDFSRDGRFPSDHFPVVVRLRLN